MCVRVQSHSDRHTIAHMVRQPTRMDSFLPPGLVTSNFNALTYLISPYSSFTDGETEAEMMD